MGGGGGTWRAAPPSLWPAAASSLKPTAMACRDAHLQAASPRLLLRWACGPEGRAPGQVRPRGQGLAVSRAPAEGAHARKFDEPGLMCVPRARSEHESSTARELTRSRPPPGSLGRLLGAHNTVYTPPEMQQYQAGRFASLYRMGQRRYRLGRLASGSPPFQHCAPAVAAFALRGARKGLYPWCRQDGEEERGPGRGMRRWRACRMAGGCAPWAPPALMAVHPPAGGRSRGTWRGTGRRGRLHRLSPAPCAPHAVEAHQEGGHCRQVRDSLRRESA
jgi:hypothetical protein